MAGADTRGVVDTVDVDGVGVESKAVDVEANGVDVVGVCCRDRDGGDGVVVART
jgi:hypothetical protein